MGSEVTFLGLGAALALVVITWQLLTLLSPSPLLRTELQRGLVPPGGGAGFCDRLE